MRTEGWLAEQRSFPRLSSPPADPLSGRMEVKYLEEARQGALCCSNCGAIIASVKDLFSLPGADGVMGAYVNPEGHVHEVRCRRTLGQAERWPLVASAVALPGGECLRSYRFGLSKTGLLRAAFRRLPSWFRMVCLATRWSAEVVLAVDRASYPPWPGS